MTYVLIIDGVVTQKQPDPENGFIEAPEWVVCGMLYDENADPQFTNPPIPEPEPQPYTLDVSILWLRLSEEEAEEFDGASTTAGPLKMRKAFATASTLNSEGDLFAWVRNILVNLFGETRADELLAEATNETSSIVAPALEE